MNTAVITPGTSLGTLPNTALKAAARFWIGIAAIGQVVFAFAVASFYSTTAMRGHPESWNRFMTHGHIPEQPIGNLVVGLHLVLAVFITLSGLVQLVPGVRARVPVLHRWNGRLYVISAFVISIAGLYMSWFRGAAGDTFQQVGISFNAILIMLCASMALRYAVARDFVRHRRWALRLFLVVSGVWFFRVGVMLSGLIFGGPFGYDPSTFRGPMLTTIGFAQTLLPLSVLELYLYARDRAGSGTRIAVATLLIVLSVATAAGIAGATRSMWLPRIAAAFDPRVSIAETLTSVIDREGMDAAVEEYHRLRASGTDHYNFDEAQLNSLGYQRLRMAHPDQAIRIFQLNVEVYPLSSNVHDSLAEAYLAAGQHELAIASYRKALELDPDKRTAQLALQTLGAR